MVGSGNWDALAFSMATLPTGALEKNTLTMYLSKLAVIETDNWQHSNFCFIIIVKVSIMKINM